ncbi:WD40 repeat [Macleaya cordata]|uniref:WD40 repeat n=1 Tax=Macleaya cordata TaxID=56857 RepID=A0A200Q1N2_MACCD|nr:WD40 repeat [Macleaya cordata]
MHRVGSAGNNSNSSRPRREKRLTYVLNDVDETKHCAGINCLAVLKSSVADGSDYLFTGSRDGTLKRWGLAEDAATCSATFESHVDWVNDAVLAGENTIVSCSSDTTLKTWNCLSDGICTRTLHQHTDYVTCLAAAEKNSNIVASGGLGGEVFIWDLEAALVHVSKSTDAIEDDSSNGTIASGNCAMPLTSLRPMNSSSNISLNGTQTEGYNPLAAKGHKDSVYALAMNDSGTVLVSGGTEKVVRVWDPRTGSKTMKLRGHTDNIRALLLDSTGRFCLSGSSDSMIRLWDLGQQRCVHSYAVHTDSVWTLASTPTFSHVYSGGRDLSLYLTDLATRESLLLCTEEHPISHLALHDDSIWVATSDSSIHQWPAEGRDPQKVFQRGSSFKAGNLSFTRARAYLEGSAAVPACKEPSLTIPGTPGIVQHEILNNRRQVLTKDTAGSVKLWEITRGIVVEDYGKVSFEEKKEELFEMVSIPGWFTTDTRLGNLSIHLETPQCFTAEMYSADLNIVGVAEDHKINLAEETLKGLMAHWSAKRSNSSGSQASANGDVQSGKDVSARNHSHSRLEVDGAGNRNFVVYPAFEFSTVSPPSIITEGSHGGPWRKKITDLDGTEDEKDIPWWCLDCVLNKSLASKENTKCSFYLHPCEGSSVQVLTQGKLSAPRILRIHKVVNYVLEKMVPDKPLNGEKSDGTLAPGPAVGLSQFPANGVDIFSSTGSKSLQNLKTSIEILCNNQVLSPEMSLATVRAYIWKKPDDLVLNYRLSGFEMLVYGHGDAIFLLVSTTFCNLFFAVAGRDQNYLQLPSKS